MADHQSEYSLGLMYANGTGVEQDFEKALECFSPAAESGLSDAEYSLGVLYHIGLGTEQQLAEGAYWYTKASEQGHAQAQCNLAGSL